MARNLRPKTLFSRLAVMPARHRSSRQQRRCARTHVLAANGHTRNDADRRLLERRLARQFAAQA
jgi:hypothetical protein